MAGSVNFTGLVSGLDTNQIIEDLMTVDSQPLTRLENQKTEYNTQRDTFTSMKSGLLDLKTTLEDIRTTASFGLFNASVSDEDAIGISASTSASEGNYSLRILALAQAKTLSGNSYQSTNTALGLSGEILINNESMKIRSTDTLTDIRNAINSLDAGVNASILKVTSTDYRLIITSKSQGAEGFTISNVGSSNTLSQLGFTDGTTRVRSVVNGDVQSMLLSSSNSTVASLTGISSQASGTVTIAGRQMEVNLATDSLTSIRDKINNLGLTGVSAEVESVEVDDETHFRLTIRGTSSFVDSGHVLESLGILEGGTSGIAARFKSSGVLYQKGGNQIAATNTALTALGAKTGETISITGVDADGAVVNDTFQIASGSKVSDFLDAVEQSFGGGVNATLDSDGRIVIESATAGITSLSVSLKANNEEDGTLDFGSMVTEMEGRERLLVEGRDSQISVNNIQITRSTNEITDVLNGLSISLLKADADTDLTVTVARDTDAITEKIDAFISAYNDFANFIKEKSSYDQETKTAGPLLGDLTARATMSRVQSVVQESVFGADFTFTNLVQIGVDINQDGTLTLDKSKLKEAMNDDMNAVVSLFSATRSSTDNDIALAYHSTKTKSGTYNVEITQAAEQAQVMSDPNISERSKNGQMTISDSNGSSLTVSYTEGMTVGDIANEINAEAEKSVSEMLRSTAALKTTSGSAVTPSTSITEIANSSVKENDTVTLSVTNRAGKTYQRILTHTADNPITIDDILNSIESLSSFEIIASTDSNGRITVEDRTSGSSSINVSISTTAKLQFGTFETVQEGRNPVAISASATTDGRLVITHDAYGSGYGFTISGGASFGIADKEYRGVDVAGSINGVAASGRGQSLTASSSDEYTRGMVLQVSLTAAELAAQGSSQGSVTLVSGIADKLYSEVSSITDSFGGFIQARIDSYDRTIESLDSRIDDMNKRLEVRRAQYVRKFTALERSLAQLDSLKQRLTASLSGLNAS